MTDTLSPGSEPNPFFLEAVANACERCLIVPTVDVEDIRGVVLWKAGKALTPTFHDRVTWRRLRQPLELTLTAPEGFTSRELQTNLLSFFESDSALAAGLLRSGVNAAKLAVALPIHPTARLLLTIRRLVVEGSQTYMTQSCALAAALSVHTWFSDDETNAVMLAAILSDIGDLYLDRAASSGATADPLDVWRLSQHPVVSRTLISRLMDYPSGVAEAVLHHHEKLDRSGFPTRPEKGTISKSGEVLGLVHSVVDRLDASATELMSAAFGVALIPGEHDLELVSMVHTWAHGDSRPSSLDGGGGHPEVNQQLRYIEANIRVARHLAHRLNEQQRSTRVLAVAFQAIDRLEVLQKTWQGMLRGDGMSHLPEQLVGDVTAQELERRIHAYHQETALLSEGMATGERLQLEGLWKLPRPSAVPI